MTKKLIAYFISFILVLMSGSVSASDLDSNKALDERIILSTGFEFEDSIANSNVLYIDSKGESVSRVTDGFMQIEKNTAGTDPYFDVDLSSVTAESVVLSMCVKKGSGTLVADLVKLRYTDNSMVSLLTLGNDATIRSGSKTVASIAENEADIAILLNRNGNYEIYVNDVLIHSANTGKTLSWQFIRCQVLPDSNTGSIYIDDFEIYSADNFGEDAEEYIIYKDFNDEKNFKEGFVRMNPGSGNSIAHKSETSLQITTEDITKDPYIDIIIPDRDTFSSLVFSADFTIKDFGTKVNVFQARTSSKEYLTDINISESGNIYLGTNKLGYLRKNESSQIAVIYDTKKATYDVYINGEKKITGKSSRNGDVERVRIQIMPNYGVGSLEIDNLAVYEGDSLKTVPDTDTLTGWSVLPSDTADIIRLKNVIAYHTAADTVFYNGEKHNIGKRPYVKDGELIIPGEMAFPITGKSEAEDISLKKLCDDYGKELLHDKTGLIIITDGEFVYKNDREILNRLSSYLFSKRPNEKQIEDLYLSSSNKGIHPRVLATADDFNYLIEQKDKNSYVADWIEDVVYEADNILETEPCEYRLQEYRLNAVVSVVLERIMTLSFAYRITENDIYAQRALEEIEKVMSFPDWNPQHFLDTAEMTFAVAIGYDWCYDYFLEEGKTDLIADAILNMGIKEGDKQYRGRATGTSFIYRDMNWNSVCNAGMCSGALAIIDKQPEIAYSTIKNSVRSIEYILPAFAPDGGWQESIGYWEYAFSYIARMSMCLETSLGTDFSIPEFTGIENSVMYAVAMNGNRGLNNYHDSDESTHISSEILWAGNYFERKDFTAYYLDKVQDKVQNDSLWRCLYYDRSTSPNATYSFEKDLLFRNLEAVSMRDSYVNENGTYLSFHAGNNNVNHRQYDAGTFVLDMLGERWASDLGTEALSYLGVSHKLLYRSRPEGHNTLVINPSAEIGQESETDCKVIKFVSKEKGAYAVVDLTSAYRNQADSVVRGFMMTDDRNTIIIRDEMSLKEKSDVYWFMHTAADVNIVDNETAILTIGNKSVQLKIKSEGAEATLMCVDAKPFDVSVGASGQADNSAYKKIAVRFTASGDVSLSVRLTPLSKKYSETMFETQKISSWNVDDGKIVAEQDDYKKEYIIESMFFDDDIVGPSGLEDYWKITSGTGSVGGMIQSRKNSIIRMTGIGGKADDDGCVVIKTENLTSSSGLDPFVQIECNDVQKDTMTYEFQVYADGEQSVYVQLIDGKKSTSRLMEIGADEMVYFSGSKALCEKKKWHDVAITLHCRKKTADIYLDGKLIAENIAASSDVKRIKIISLYTAPPSGETRNGMTAIDNIRVYKGEKENWYYNVISDEEIYVKVSSESGKKVYVLNCFENRVESINVVKPGEDLRVKFSQETSTKLFVWDKYYLYPEMPDIKIGGNKNE